MPLAFKMQAWTVSLYSAACDGNIYYGKYRSPYNNHVVIIYPLPVVYIIYSQSGVNTALKDVEDYLVSGFFLSPTVLDTEHNVSKIDLFPSSGGKWRGTYSADAIPGAILNHENCLERLRNSIRNKNPFISFKKRIFHYHSLKCDKQRVKLSSATSNY